MVKIVFTLARVILESVVTLSQEGVSAPRDGCHLTVRKVSENQGCSIYKKRLIEYPCSASTI